MQRSFLALGVLLGVCAGLLGACTKTSSKYCGLHPEDPRCADVDASTPTCTSNTECDPTAPICDLAQNTCVQCIAPDQLAQCGPSMPVCGDDHTCRGCQAHTECTSDACLPSGACADTADVAYVAPGGSGSACALDVPCGTLADAEATDKSVIKIASGQIIDGGPAVFDDRTVQILADPGASIERSDNGVILEVKGTANLTIDDLVITGGGGPGGHAIHMSGGTPDVTLRRVKIVDNEGLGVLSTSGRLTISQSIFAHNDGGGVNAAMTEFFLTNNLFVANGSAVSTTGGLTLSPAAASYRFDFNTVAGNASTLNTLTTRGVNCSIPMDVSNSIFAGNAISASCNATHSLFDPGTSVTGTNVAGNPQFKNTDPAAYANPNYYRIGPTSAGKNLANPASTEPLDIDGDARPQEGRADMGADEIVP